LIGISEEKGDERLVQHQQNKMTHSSKSYFIQRFEDHEKLGILSRMLYSIYCSLSGSFHPLPAFYLLGVQKSGTTALFDYLTQHPCVSQTIKDIRFFDKYYQKGSNWYRLHFPLNPSKIFSQKTKNKQYVVGDATERYFEYPHAPQRIQSLTPNAKFLIILRNPVERTYSHYNFNVIRNKENRTFEDAIDKESKRTKVEYTKMEKDKKFYSDYYFRYAYLDRSIYATKLKRWFQIFPKEQFFIIENNELLNNTAKIYKDVLRFLNLPNLELPKYEKIFAKKYKKPKMEQLTRQQLVEFFQPYNDELYRLLGTKYDWN